MPTKPHRVPPALALASGLVLLGLIVFLLVRPPARPALPNPNGYDDFVTATELVRGDAINEASTLDHDKLLALVSTLSEHLQRESCVLAQEFEIRRFPLSICL